MGGTGRKEGLTVKTGEGENGKAPSRGILGIFLLDAARKVGLKERDLNETTF